VAYAKLAAGLVQLLPGVIWMLIIAMVAPISQDYPYPADYDPPNLALYNWSQFPFFLHLAAYLSVVVRRGALAMAFGLFLLITVLFQIFFQLVVFRTVGGGTADGNWLMETVYNTFGALLLAACIAAHPLIGRRLRTLAAE
jgi:hypothetical protein